MDALNHVQRLLQNCSWCAHDQLNTFKILNGFKSIECIISFYRFLRSCNTSIVMLLLFQLVVSQSHPLVSIHWKNYSNKFQCNVWRWALNCYSDTHKKRSTNDSIFIETTRVEWQLLLYCYNAHPKYAHLFLQFLCKRHRITIQNSV